MIKENKNIDINSIYPNIIPNKLENKIFFNIRYGKYANKK